MRLNEYPATKIVQYSFAVKKEERAFFWAARAGDVLQGGSKHGIKRRTTERGAPRMSLRSHDCLPQ
jgi:hypothetical protein